MDVYFVYGLVDSGEPDVIRYVGQTHSMIARLREHYTPEGQYFGAPGAWKKGVLYFGRRIEMVLLEVVYGTRLESIARERWHIENQERIHGRIVNGPVYNARQEAHGISKPVVTAYIGAVFAFHGLLADGVSRRGRGISQAAHVVDLMPSTAIYAVEFRHPHFGWLRIDREFSTLEGAKTYNAMQGEAYPRRVVELTTHAGGTE